MDESGADGRVDWIHQTITTFFESEYRLFGNEALRKYWINKIGLSFVCVCLCVCACIMLEESTDFVPCCVYLAYSQSAWEEMDAGHYEFPFALKVRKKNEKK